MTYPDRSGSDSAARRPPLPQLTAPVLVAAFEGWNDAGDAASTAIEHLQLSWDATPLAELDPEDYYDFQVTRPTATIDSEPPSASCALNVSSWEPNSRTQPKPIAMATAMPMPIQIGFRASLRPVLTRSLN